MSFLTGAKTGAEQSPWSAVLNEVNASYERRRKEDATRDAEERQLKQIFAKLAVENKNAVDLQNLKGEQDITKVYHEGVAKGTLRRPMAGTPAGAIGEAMQAPAPSLQDIESGVPSLDTGGYGYQLNPDQGMRYSNVSGRIQPPTSRDVPQDMAQGILKQTGIAPNVVTAPSGEEFEQVAEEDKPLTATERNYKRKQQKEFSEEYQENITNLDFVNEAEPLIDKLPTGLGGKIKIQWMNNFDPNNPILGDWQKVKSILTDTTLLKSMETKGAISDREMDEFKVAAANDDVSSIPRLKAAFSRYKKKLESDQKSKIDGYFKQFGEDPRGEMIDSGEQKQSSQSKLTPQQRQELIQKIRNKSAR